MIQCSPYHAFVTNKTEMNLRKLLSPEAIAGAESATFHSHPQVKLKGNSHTLISKKETQKSTKLFLDAILLQRHASLPQRSATGFNSS